MIDFLESLLNRIGIYSKRQLDYVYLQRNIAVLAFAKSIQQAMAELSLWNHARNEDLSFDVSIYQDDNSNWDDDWRTVVQITNRISKRQISWHLDPESAKVASAIFSQNKTEPWDGSDFSKTFEYLGVKNGKV